MAKVNTFTTLGTLYSDTKVAGQVPGNGAAASPFQASLSSIYSWVLAQLPAQKTAVLAPAGMASGSVGSQAVAANQLVTHIVITATGAGTVNIGTSSGGSQIAAALPYINGTVTLAADEAFMASGSLFFSGHSHTLTVKIITISIA